MNATSVKSDTRPIKTVDMINIAQLVDSEDNPRIELQNLEDLARSIKNVGILQPLIVKRTKNEGEYEIVAGHRRKAAAKIAGQAEVPCVVVDTSEGSLVRYHLIENLQRDGLTPFETGIAVYSAMLRKGEKQKNLAQTIGKSEAWISKYNTIGSAAEKANDQQMNELVACTDGEKCYELANEILGKKVSTAKQEKAKQQKLPETLDDIIFKRGMWCNPYTVEAMKKTANGFLVSIEFFSEEDAKRFFK